MTMQELSADAREVLFQARQLKKLSEYPEWATFISMLQNRVDNEATTVMGPAMTVNDVLPKEHAKGVFTGLRLAMSLPAITMFAAKDIREKNPNAPEFRKQAKQEAGDETEIGSNVPPTPNMSKSP